ncbi:zinc-finger domain-containing protein [Bacillus cereus]
MDARDIRIHILNLLDQHCVACEQRTNRSPKYCMENCKVGEHLYRLGKKLHPDVKKSENMLNGGKRAASSESGIL